MSLSGDSVTLAWSPGGTRLSIVIERRDDYEGVVYDRTLVYRTETRETAEVSPPDDQNPVWVDEAHYATSCRGSSCERAGVTLSSIDDPEFVQQISSMPWTLGSDSEGNLLLGEYANQSYQWSRYSAQNGTLESAPDLLGSRPWTMGQCQQAAGNVVIRGERGLGLWLEVDGRPFLLSDTPPFHYPIQRDWFVDPCLSPDLGRVAYVKRGGTIDIIQVPDIVELRTQPSPIAMISGGEAALGLDEAGLVRHQTACETTGSRRCSDRRFRREVVDRDMEGAGATTRVSTFFMERSEVSRAQYQRCVLAGSCPAIDESECDIYDGEDWGTGRELPDASTLAEAPRTCVTQGEAASYCAFIGRRLPSEAEWELAAVGKEDKRIFAWGDEFSAEHVSFLGHEPASLDLTWSRAEGETPEGLRHMSGNAYEWVAGAACPYAEWVDGAPACDSTNGVLRGGSFVSDGGGVRATYRRFTDPENRSDTNGFRCAQTATLDMLDAELERLQLANNSVRTPDAFNARFRDENGSWGLIMDDYTKSDYYSIRNGSWSVAHITLRDGLITWNDGDNLFERHMEDGLHMSAEIPTLDDLDQNGQEELSFTIETEEVEDRWVTSYAVSYTDSQLTRWEPAVAEGETLPLQGLRPVDLPDGGRGLRAIWDRVACGSDTYHLTLLATPNPEGAFTYHNPHNVAELMARCPALPTLEPIDEQEPEELAEIAFCTLLWGGDFQPWIVALESYCNGQDEDDYGDWRCTLCEVLPELRTLAIKGVPLTLVATD